jgi:hypothetical protein
MKLLLDESLLGSIEDALTSHDAVTVPERDCLCSLVIVNSVVLVAGS